MIERGPYADRTWLLHTADAHELYRKFGFGAPGGRLMERPAAAAGTRTGPIPPGSPSGEPDVRDMDVQHAKLRAPDVAETVPRPSGAAT